MGREFHKKTNNASFEAIAKKELYKIFKKL